MTKFYLHRTEVSTPATLPTGEQSSLTADSNLFDNEDGTENRRMDTTISAVAQTTLTNTSTNDTNAHNYYIARWVSNTLYQAKIDANTWTLEYGASESNAAANFPVSGSSTAGRVNCYVWKPSTQTVVGTILDGNTNADCEEAGTSQSLINCTFAGSAVTGIVPGDAVLVFELWAVVTQANSTARTQTIFYDGTTEGSTTNNASFLSTPETFQFTADQTGQNATVLMSNKSVTSTANTNQFWNISGKLFVTTTEAEVQIPIRKAGTLKKLQIRITANTVTGSTTFTIFKNGNSTALVGTMSTTGAQYVEDLTNTVSVSAGDKISVKSVPGAATNTFTVQYIAVIFEETDTQSTTCLQNVADASTLSSASTTVYVEANGSTAASTTNEATQKIRQKVAGTYNNYFLYVQSNARTTTSTFKSRKNAQDGGMSIAVTSGQTGLFEYSGGTDTIADGDDYNYSVTTGSGTENLIFQLLGAHFTTTNYTGLLCIGSGSSITVNANLTRNFSVLGELVASTTETDVQLKLRLSYVKVQGLQVFVFTGDNTLTASTTIKLRKNTANGNQTVSYASGVDGLASDGSNSDNCGSNDLINTQTITGATGTSIKYRFINMYYKTNLPINYIQTMATETVTSSETLARVFGAVRPLSTETVTITDTNQPSKLLALSRPLSTETVTISEQLDRVKGLVRALSTETVTSGESLARMLAATRALPETTTSGETLTRMLAANRSLSTETVTISDQLDRVRGVIRALATETVTIDESLTRMLAANRALSTETVTSGETLTRQYNAVRALSTETVTVAETLTRLLAATRALSTETVTISDQLDRTRGINRSLSETTNISEQLTRLLAATRNLTTETTTIGESLARMLAATRTISESSTISDQLDSLYTPGGEGHDKIRTLSETVIISESLTRMIAANRVLATEITDITDQLDRIYGANRSLSETTTIGESLSRLLAATRALSETVSSSDILSKLQTLTRTFSETVNSSESINRMLAATRSFTESSTVSDQLDRIRGVVQSLVETINISDQLDRVFNGTRQLIESVTVSDSLIRSIVRAIIPTKLHNIVTWMRQHYTETDPS